MGSSVVNIQQLEEAVSIALNPAFNNQALKQQAIAYVEELKNSNDGWLALLELFVKKPRSSPEIRFVCLQVLEEVIRSRYTSLQPNQQSILRSTLWNYLTADLDTVSDPVYIRNKFAHVLVLLFSHTYLTEWPSFFDELISLVETSLASSSSSGNNTLSGKPLTMVDMFVRISESIDAEIVCLLISRSATELNRNSAIKDTMRRGDVGKLVNMWMRILFAYYQPHPDIANSILNIIGLFVSWIDIKLVVNDQFMPSLFQFMTMETLQISATKCLSEIISKGMSPTDKLGLVQFLNIPNLLSSLKLDSLDFIEHIAKLVNTAGLELYQVWNDLGSSSSASSSSSSSASTMFSVTPSSSSSAYTSTNNNTNSNETTKQAALDVFLDLFTYVLKLLENENNEVSELVFGFVDAYTKVLKKLKKDLNPPTPPRPRASTAGNRAGTASVTPLVVSQAWVLVMEKENARVVELMRVLLVKSKYEDGAEVHLPFAVGTPGVADVEDGESSEFLEFRKNVKVFFDALATIDESLFTNYISSFVCSIFDRVTNAQATGKPITSTVTWPECELALYILYIFGECTKTPNDYTLATTASESKDPSRLTQLGSMIMKMVSCDIVSFPHILISSLYFEIVVRYVQFFDLYPDCIPRVLMAFVGDKGLHHGNRKARSRTNYMFLRYAKHLKAFVATYLDTLLSSISDLLVIMQPKPTSKPMDAKTPLMDTEFESHIFLLEAVGLLISADAVPITKQVEYATAVLAPIVTALQEVISRELYKMDTPPDNMMVSVYVARLVACVGGFAKGFPEFDSAHLQNRLSGNGSLSCSSTASSSCILPNNSASSVLSSASLSTSTTSNMTSNQTNSSTQPSSANNSSSSTSGPSSASNSSSATLIPVPWSPVFNPSLEMIAILIERLGNIDIPVLREACRYSYVRLIPCIGKFVLDYFKKWLPGMALSPFTNAKEITDFLPCLALMIHKFHMEMYVPLDELLNSFMERIFFFLNQSTMGTDDAILLMELRKAYLGFISGLLTSGLDGVMISEKNVSNLNLVLQSILHYALDPVDAPTQRLAFAILGRMIAAWLVGSNEQQQTQQQGAQVNGNDVGKKGMVGQPGGLSKPRLPGFESFVSEHIVQALFEAPLKGGFSITDGGSLLVFGEIATIHHLLMIGLGGNGATYMGYLTESFFPRMQCPPELANVFVGNLQSCFGQVVQLAAQGQNVPQANVQAAIRNFRKFLGGWFGSVKR